MANTKRHVSNIKKEFAKQLLVLTTGGLGLVAALAWNELIKEIIDSYLKPLLGGVSGIISLLVYALIVTFLAVFIAYSLTKITKKA